jgi:hypothetical protein
MICWLNQNNELRRLSFRPVPLCDNSQKLNVKGQQGILIELFRIKMFKKIIYRGLSQ